MKIIIKDIDNPKPRHLRPPNFKLYSYLHYVAFRRYHVYLRFKAVTDTFLHIFIQSRSIWIRSLSLLQLVFLNILVIYGADMADLLIHYIGLILHNSVLQNIDILSCNSSPRFRRYFIKYFKRNLLLGLFS